MNRALVVFVIVAISYALGTCPPTGQAPAEKFTGTHKVIKKYKAADFVAKNCASLTITKDGTTNFKGTLESKKDKDTKNDDTKLIITKDATNNKYNIKHETGGQSEGDYVFLLTTEKTHVLVSCTTTSGVDTYKGFILGETSTEIDAQIKAVLPTDVKYEDFTDIDHSKDKCGGDDSGAALLVPSILTGIIMLLVTKLF